jgi:hypothetical protein
VTEGVDLATFETGLRPDGGSGNLAAGYRHGPKVFLLLINHILGPNPFALFQEMF